jgi:hypothetical protein
MVLRRAPSIISSSATARVHAGAAEQHLPLSGEDALQHALHIVVAVGSLLPGLGADDRVGHQEHGDIGVRIVLQERMGQPQGVVAALGPIGRVVQDKQGLHLVPLAFAEGFTSRSRLIG